jgi:hypothetical protein
MQRSFPSRFIPGRRLAPHGGPDETDYAQRHFVNLVSAAFLLFIALAITWTLVAVTEGEKQMRCVESGRRDCVTIATPPRGMRAVSH